MRRRRSSRSSSGTSTRKGRTAGWVSIGCTTPPVERLGVISPAVLHNEVKCEVLRSEEHTSELQSRQYLVCRLLLEKKKKKNRVATFNVTNSQVKVLKLQV